MDRTQQSHTATTRRPEPSGSAPSTPTEYGAPSLGAHLGRITFPIHADTAFGEGDQ
jgi:hypothetical protein